MLKAEEEAKKVAEAKSGGSKGTAGNTKGSAASGARGGTAVGRGRGAPAVRGAFKFLMIYFKTPLCRLQCYVKDDSVKWSIFIHQPEVLQQQEELQPQPEEVLGVRLLKPHTGCV